MFLDKVVERRNKMKGNEKKRSRKKQLLILSVIFLLLCVSGVGIYFLMNMKRTNVVMVTEEDKWDVAWYDADQDEFVITTREELFGLAELSRNNNFKGKTIKLGADIVVNEGNAENWAEESPELEWMPIGRDDVPFNGIFDGQGHTISGLYFNGQDEMVGLFAATDDDSQVLNLNVVNSYYKTRGDSGVGGVAARGAGFFSRVYCDAIIECDGFTAGGIIGYKKNKGNAVISECWFDGKVTLSGRMGGGIAGRIYKGGCTIQHCLNTGTIYSTHPGPTAATIGGITGNVSERLIITDCFNAGYLSNEVGRPEVATLIGSISAAGDITSGHNWSISEGAPGTVGSINSDAVVVGAFMQLPEKVMKGYGAYQRTDLDFDTYWAVVEDDTPMLQCFADSIPSVEGYQKCMQEDTSWYDVTRIENVISTPEQLKGFAYLSMMGESFYGKTIKLGANITYNTGDASKYAEDIPLNLWIPLTNFMGTFDGQGHTISGLYVGGAASHVGMFATTTSQAIVKNFKLTNSYFESTTSNNNFGTGSIAGSGGGTFERIYSDAIVVTSAQFGGGIVGLFNHDGSITECWFDGEVATAGRRSGGIVAGCYPYYVSGNPVKTETKISHCLNTGYIHRTNKTATDSATSAGIVGVVNKNNTTVIEDCFSAGLVTSPKYESGKNDELGAIVSAIADGGVCTIRNSWGTIQSYKKVVTTIKKTAVSNISMSQVLDEALVTGFGAVRLTTLDFSKYWAVDTDGTPVLKHFAANAPSLAGVILPNTSWYSESKKDFVINTVEELYGFSVLANTGVDFEGKTVKLGKDITVNTGNAAEWATKAPTNNWFPIKEFRGTFDGQGHTISGIYSVDSKDENIGRGLFAKTEETSVIKNLKVVNSYFETKTEYALSAISSRGCGVFKNIYTDAILNNTGGGHTGGILGMQLWNDTTIENCWFDGQITDPGRRIGGILGYSSNNKATIAHCLFTGSITRNCAKDETIVALAGGIVGTARGTMLINDCLSVGTLSTKRTKTDVMGSLIGETVKECDIKLQNIYASSNVWTKAIGSNGSKAKTSSCYVLADVYFKGENASLLTELDFKNYWAVVKDSAPELKTFAKGSVISNPKVADTSWYDGNENKISDVGDLYGFLKLSKSKDFAGEVIQLGAGFEVNSGDAQNFKDMSAIAWNPINNFAGEFNGNGYTISGLYGIVGAGDTNGIGFFSKTKQTANIHDFSLVNTYFESSTNTGMGGIASRGQGTFKNLHTDVILYNTLEQQLNSKDQLEDAKVFLGGIVGIAYGELTIENCWSESDITAAGRYAGGMLGYANKQTVTIEHCLNSGTLHRIGSRVNTSYADYGGIIGSATADKVVKINDCLNTGIIKSDRTVATTTQKEVGHIAGEGPGTANMFFVSNSYSVDGNCFTNTEIVSFIVGVQSSKAVVSDCAILEAGYLKGVHAFQNTTLDFKDEAHWVLRGDQTDAYLEYPVLKAFYPNELDYLAGVVKYNTNWFNETTNKGTISTAADLYGMQVLQAEGKFNKDTLITLGKDIVVNTLADGENVSKWSDPDNAPLNKWTAIGTKDNPFVGTFNGRGYKITGLYGLSSTGELGLFAATTADTEISDLTLDNCYFEITGGAYIGAVVGRGGGTFNRIHIGKNVIVRSMHDNNAGIYAGGIIGLGDKVLKISNSWFEGFVENSGKFSGGFVGGINAVTDVTLEHSLSNGIIKRTNALNKNAGLAGLIGRMNANTAMTITDCLSLSTVGSYKNNAVFTGDEVGLIVGSCTDTATLTYSNTYGLKKTDSTSTLIIGAGNKAKTAYNGKGYELEEANIKGTSIDTAKVKLDFTNYWLMVDNAYPELLCFKTIQPDTLWFDETANKGTILTAADLYGFAKLAADGKFNNNTVITLGDDIVINELKEGQSISDWADSNKAPLNKWTPINNFAGTFNGNGYTISGLYGVQNGDNGMGMALFANTVATTKISHLTLDNIYFELQDAYWMSALVSKGGGIIDRIHVGKNVWLNESDADKTQGVATNKTSDIGGIIGMANRGGTISNCWFEGRITSYGQFCGGIVAMVNNDCTVSVEHCLVSGTVERVANKVKLNKNGGFGGICGKVDRASTLNIKDSLHIGTVTSTLSGDPIGLFVGSAPNKNSSKVAATVTVTNSYSIASGSLTNMVGEASVAMEQHNTGAWLVEKSAITGTAINTDNIKLDFTNNWIMIEGKTPELKVFQ